MQQERKSDKPCMSQTLAFEIHHNGALARLRLQAVQLEGEIGKPWMVASKLARMACAPGCKLKR